MHCSFVGSFCRLLAADADRALLHVVFINKPCRTVSSWGFIDRTAAAMSKKRIFLGRGLMLRSRWIRSKRLLLSWNLPEILLEKRGNFIPVDQFTISNVELRILVKK